jgi:hypothetical protein
VIQKKKESLKKDPPTQKELAYSFYREKKHLKLKIYFGTVVSCAAGHIMMKYLRTNRKCGCLDSADSSTLKQFSNGFQKLIEQGNKSRELIVTLFKNAGCYSEIDSNFTNIQ